MGHTLAESIAASSQEDTPNTELVQVVNGQFGGHSTLWPPNRTIEPIMSLQVNQEIRYGHFNLNDEAMNHLYGESMHQGWNDHQK